MASPCVLLLCIASLCIASLLSSAGCARGSDAPSAGSEEDVGPQPTSSTSVPPSSEGDSAAPSPSIRITTNLIEPEEVPPIPEGFELLYVTGKDVPARLEVFLVDGEMLYWAQRALLWRAPKDGSGEPVAFGAWETTNQGSALASDATYIYWHDGPHLKRKRRDTTDLAVSTPVTTYNIPWVDDRPDFRFREGIEEIDYGASSSMNLMAKDATHLYVAPNSCTPIYKVDLETLEAELLELEYPEYPGGGNTAMTVDETHVYCGNTRNLLRIQKDGTGGELLYDAFGTLWSLVVSADRIFVLDRAGSGHSSVLALDRGDGALVNLWTAPDGGGASSIGSPLQFDPIRQQLYYGIRWVKALDVQSGDFRSAERLGLSFAFTSDKDYVYWGGQPQPGVDNTVVTILRQHKDRLGAMDVVTPPG